MANAPQGGSTDHAQGAHPIGYGNYDDVAPVKDVELSNRDESIDNRVQSIDITKIANDEADDADYDDPYPGGPSGTIGVPGDG